MTKQRDLEAMHSDDIVAAPGPEQAALAPLSQFMTAWNAKDMAGMDASFHFPHARIASGKIHILEQPTARQTNFFDQFIAQTGWAYSLWDYRRAVQSTDDKVHFAVQFTRYRDDDSVIGHYPSMWIVALIDGKWGVQARSSFAP
ncbi:MAG: hypothetical protein AAF512_03500 [Pseudomonadota bacterium]